MSRVRGWQISGGSNGGTWLVTPAVHQTPKPKPLIGKGVPASKSWVDNVRETVIAQTTRCFGASNFCGLGNVPHKNPMGAGNEIRCATKQRKRRLKSIQCSKSTPLRMLYRVGCACISYVSLGGICSALCGIRLPLQTLPLPYSRTPARIVSPSL